MDKSNKKNPLVIAGYLFAIFGGFFGLLIGLILRFSKKLTKDNNKIYLYDEGIRKEAKVIIWISIVVLIIFTTNNLIKADLI